MIMQADSLLNRVGNLNFLKFPLSSSVSSMILIIFSLSQWGKRGEGAGVPAS